jgi:hypothetical protein
VGPTSCYDHLLANYLQSDHWRLATQVTRLVMVAERRLTSGTAAVLSCCNKALGRGG